MSAYIVDRETIQYLVQSGLEAAFQHHQGHKMRWYHEGESHWLDDRNASDVGQMLWDENIASVACRYSDPRHEGLPGPANESGYVYFHEDTTVGYIWKPAQILKATDCYEYQSCEHPGWATSSAKALIDVLRKLAWTRVAGYEDAQWGHPVAKVGPSCCKGDQPMVTDTLEATAYQAIELRRVRPDPEQPRKTFDEEALQELAKSMGSNGLLQPVVVRPNGSGYILIAGERRWRAACLLGWETIPAIVRSDVTLGEAAKLQLLENIVRQNLNPVEEARALQSIQDEGYTLKELSDATGIAPSQIAWRVKMLDAREDVLELVTLEHIKPSMCYEMSKLSPDGQGRVLRAITSEKLNTDEVTQFCRHVLAEESQAEMFPETKLSKEQIRAVQTFGQAFAQIGRTLARIQRMEEDQPGLLQKAFEAEAVVVEAQVDVSIQQLSRIKRALRDVRIRNLVEVSN